MSKRLSGAWACVALLLASFSAQAGDRTYVSINGNDSNNCFVEGAPCKTFGTAITKAGASGEVYCLDRGFFGAFAITNSVSIFCEGGLGQAGATVNTINLPANGEVVLNGISIDERNFAGDALTITGRGRVILRNMSIRNATNAISFKPSGNASLVISNTNLENSANVGVLIQPDPTAASVKADIEGLNVSGSVGGVAAIAQAGTLLEVEIRNSHIVQNGNFGVLGATNGGASVVFVEKSSITNNGQFGLLAQGASAFVLVSDSLVARNATGWAFAAGGNLITFNNNAFNNNAGSASGAAGLR